MLREPTSWVFRLGDHATTRGNLDHVNLRAHRNDVTLGTELIGHPSSYAPYDSENVICIDDRLSGAAGLAGGALSIAIMHNYLFGGELLSQAFRSLQEHGEHLSLHELCGALELAINGFIQRHLGNVNADGYKLLESLGYNIPMASRQNIAAWAVGLPHGFIDLDESMNVVREILGVTGDHLAGFVGVSLVHGHGFTAHEELRHKTGMLAFRFDPTIAFRKASCFTAERAKLDEAAYLALVFTAEVLLELTGPDLVVGVYC